MPRDDVTSECDTLSVGKAEIDIDNDVRLAAPHGKIVIGGYEVAKNKAIAGSIFGMISFGFLFGLAIPNSSDDPHPWDKIGAVIGWIYFAAWSISFYPQVYLNWVRKSVVGMSFDFVFLNLVGFACYSAFNVAYFFIDAMKDDYKEMHDGSSSPVRANDVVFSLHAELLTIVTLIQIFMYERGGQKFHILPIISMIGVFIIFGAWAIYLIDKGGRYSDHNRPWIWMDWFSGLSWVKLAISVVKYTPQVYLNWKRKRTTGWNIWNVLLDFTGGALSVCQLMITCISQDDWTSISGDPVKFGLGFCSMFFDTIFMIQHYGLYADGNRADVEQDKEKFDENDGSASGDFENPEADEKTRLVRGDVNSH